MNTDKNMKKEKNNWVKFQWFVGRILFKLGFINRILWNCKWPNKVFYYNQ